jgi:indolepyruvate ferredoxin oxidoreductase
LNGTAVESNKQSFRWGRLAAVDPARVSAAAIPRRTGFTTPVRVARRDHRAPHRIPDRLPGCGVCQALHGSRRKGPRGRSIEDRRDDALTEAVARYYFKLLAIKDEFEVARLYTETDFTARVAAQFEGDYKLTFHLAPPVFNKPDPVTAKRRRSVYGPWMMSAFRVLAKLRRFRGTALDPFSKTAERRMERALIGDYETIVAELAALAPHNHSLAVELAQIPEHIRGYGHVKDRHVVAAKKKEAELLAAFRDAKPVGPKTMACADGRAERPRGSMLKRRFRRGCRRAGSASPSRPSPARFDLRGNGSAVMPPVATPGGRSASSAIEHS